MVVDDEGNGGGGGGGGGGGRGPGGAIPAVGSGLGGMRRMTGMAGLLDAGIISEALPASSHRVQAWDFTTGNTPDIADSKFLFEITYSYAIEMSHFCKTRPRLRPSGVPYK